MNLFSKQSFLVLQPPSKKKKENKKSMNLDTFFYSYSYIFLFLFAYISSQLAKPTTTVLTTQPPTQTIKIYSQYCINCTLPATRDGHGQGMDRVYPYPTQNVYPWISGYQYPLLSIPNCYPNLLSMDIHNLSETHLIFSF